MLCDHYGAVVNLFVDPVVKSRHSLDPSSTIKVVDVERPNLKSRQHTAALDDLASIFQVLFELMECLVVGGGGHGRPFLDGLSAIFVEFERHELFVQRHASWR
ncbi:hypothetical protein BKM31_50235 [[Actinomadura] parvosata subsp. kistnae]|uniref:Uncharacterized protein n=1 Tax=[Actinomadura] parvosata subsp. kistnae TaxID=1909395 RepID=A0A1V0AEE0_9ACTN|nr:hypothetical protein BKM31_50235 [Nonomuraea sp. ATCC 55076]